VTSLVRALLPLVLASAFAAGARAHESPHGTLLVWESDASEATPLIVTNRGLVFNDEVDGATRFSLRCSEAYGANTSDRPMVFLDGSERVTIGMFSGVFATSDRACSKELGTGLPEGESLGGLTRITSPRTRLLVPTRTFTGKSGVYKSEDGGETWSESFRSPADQYYERLIAAPSDPQRVYAAGQRADRVNTTVIFLCSISLDGGASWKDQTVPTKLSPFAVHPTDPDVVFAYQPSDMLETEFRVLRSEDGGANFTPVLERVRKPTSIAVSAPGVLWLGIGEAGGLFRSADEGRTFEQVHKDSVQSVTCLIQRGERLWMCGNMAPNSNGVWYSDDAGGSFEKLLSFEEVTHPVMCDDLEAQVTCSRAWYDFDLELHPPKLGGDDAGAQPGEDAGEEPQEDDAGTPIDTNDEHEAPPPRQSSGCQAQRSGAPGATAWAALLAVCALVVGRGYRAGRARRTGLRG
jgi:hypothetical protein